MAALAALPSVPTALETYLGFLDTSGSATEKDTPHIDRVLRDQRQRRTEKKGEKLEGEGGASSSGTTTRETEGDYELRLMQLEKQLSELLQKNKPAQRKAPSTRKPRPPEELTSTSSGSCDEESSAPQTLSRTPRAAEDQPTTSSPNSLRLRGAAVTERRGHRRGGGGGVRKTSSDKKAGAGGAEWDRNGRRRPGSDGVGKERGKRQQGTSVVVVREDRGEGEIEKVSSIQQDQEVKTQLALETQKQQQTNQINTQLKMVSRQLEEESERRAKAEKAAACLVEHVRSLQTQLEQSTRERESAIVRASKLEGELRTERERGVAREEEGEKMEESLATVRRELESVRERLAEREGTLREREKEASRREIEHTTERTELLGRVRAAELASSGHERETEMLQVSIAETKRQLQQMQELLATRERDHQKALQNCKPLDGREVQELVRCGVEQERERMGEVVEQHKLRLGEQQKAYQALEDEFRLALRIEASRYQELRDSFETVQGEVEGYRSTAESALRKEQKATHMVAELTAIVREQRGRLSELARSKQESTRELKERVSVLEVEAREKHRLEVRVQSLQEENSSLRSQLTAQQSVLEGLRGERQLWSQELAQQGAELAQDRGRMEAQIEALSTEALSLKEDLEHARDVVRVKEKVAADQQASISQLREALAGREREGEEARMDWEHEQQSIQLQLEQEQEASAHLQDELSAAVERKAQLKEELATIRDELAQCRGKYSKLRGEWEERVKVINSLEESLAQVQTTFSERETALARDREEAARRASLAEERLKESETTHQHQLEAQKASHDSHMTQLTQKKDQEIEAANRKVGEVEREMRELLVEVGKEKRTMEARAQRLSLALHQLQEDLSH